MTFLEFANLHPVAATVMWVGTVLIVSFCTVAATSKEKK